MAETTIIFPKCKNEIKLIESLAAPLIESTRRAFEQRLAQKDLDIVGREKMVREQEDAVAKAKAAIESQVTGRLTSERYKIAAEEAKKARLALGTDLQQKTKRLTELQDVWKQRDEESGETQNAQATLKQRELDDAKSELELTVEKRVQAGLDVTGQKAHKKWSKREEQIERVIQSIVGRNGDLQGIADKTFQKIEALEFKASADAQ